MLQRAASNAYSWWWASHIRTKQSKWLEQNLQDMEEKVQTVMKLIEEDGDSFRKRAEMYYKKRPELIHFVEESYRAYRALAERYDHISTELQNANNTIAYVFPEQVQFAMEDDEDEGPPRFPRKASADSSKVSIPKVPNLPKELKGIFSTATKKMQPKNRKPTQAAAKGTASKSGLSKADGLKEIDKMQKQILGLQTEKEFAKSSYEGGLAKYWEIDSQIKVMQEKVCNLQDEFGAGSVIEDDEARTLMASAALKSCQETLSQLEKKQEKSEQEAAVERKRITNLKQKLKSLKDEVSNGENDQVKPQAVDGSAEVVEQQKSSDQEGSSDTQVREELESLRKRITEQFEVGSNSSVTVTQLVEKIDALVVKVISIESSVSSQTALIQRLKAEIDELQAQIRALEDDKAALIGGKKDTSNKMKVMEEKLHEIEHLNQKVEDQNISLQTQFTEARCNLDQLSQKLHDVKPDDDLVDIKPKKEKRKKGKKISYTPVYTQDAVQNVKPEKEVKVSGSQTDDAPKEAQNVKSGKEEVDHRQEDDRDKGVQNVKPEKEVKVSDNQPDGDKEVQKLKPDELKVSDSQCDRDKEVHNLKPEEELKVSDSQRDGEKEVQKVQPQEKLMVSHSQRDNDKELQNVQPEEELKVSARQHDDDDGHKEKQNVKPTDQIKAAESSQQSGGSVAESLSTELKQEEGKLEHSGGFRKAVAEKTEEHGLRSSEENQGGCASLPQTANDTRDSAEPTERFDKRASSRKLNDSAQVEESFDKRASSKRLNDSVGEAQNVAVDQDDEPDWKELYMKGMENREQTLLAEYTVVLRNFKEVKKKLAETQNKGDSLFEVMLQLKELKSSNEKKDEQIRNLNKKLSLLQAGQGGDNESSKSTVTESPTTIEKDDIQLMLERVENMSEVEMKFRANIDEVLEENLDFWLRFSNTFQQIQRFETEIEDLQSEVNKLESKRRQEGGSGSSKYYLKSDARPLYRHLREINTELTVWLEKGMLLKDEVKSRFSSLCAIQEEITAALKESAEDDDFKFTSYQAAKFQGEILNMKQENKKVADELQAGLDHIASLQLEVDRSLAKLNDDFKLSEPKPSQLEHSESRSRVPLRSFIFGIKQKKQKHSILACVHPALQKKYNGFKSGMHL
ncbi:hypothetical protein Tsubulata_002684 [Turnera subulata]|uniref:NAB domain-containing protein n=1 Tax=Turnera subulata TaxID=218843 RepID=A0A9Q0F751_9ROSI|nr:hypothetical protein Tsubulata_002684 [Turnera subulata]